MVFSHGLWLSQRTPSCLWSCSRINFNFEQICPNQDILPDDQFHQGLARFGRSSQSAKNSSKLCIPTPSPLPNCMAFLFAVDDEADPDVAMHTWTETILNPTWVYLDSTGATRTPSSRSLKWARRALKSDEYCWSNAIWQKIIIFPMIKFRMTTKSNHVPIMASRPTQSYNWDRFPP